MRTPPNACRVKAIANAHQIAHMAPHVPKLKETMWIASCNEQWVGRSARRARRVVKVTALDKVFTARQSHDESGREVSTGSLKLGRLFGAGSYGGSTGQI